jgi:hypothetical protein
VERKERKAGSGKLAESRKNTESRYKGLKLTEWLKEGRKAERGEKG